ncbi:unnamed protein product [Sphagnum balticum]
MALARAVSAMDHDHDAVRAGPLDRARAPVFLLLRAKDLPHGVAAIGNRQAARFEEERNKKRKEAREDQDQDGNNKEALSLCGFGDSEICGACRRRRRRRRRVVVGENRTARTRRSGKRGKGEDGEEGGESTAPACGSRRTKGDLAG